MTDKELRQKLEVMDVGSGVYLSNEAIAELLALFTKRTAAVANEARLDEWKSIDRNYFTTNTRLFTYADFRIAELSAKTEKD